MLVGWFDWPFLEIRSSFLSPCYFGGITPWGVRGMRFPTSKCLYRRRGILFLCNPETRAGLPNQSFVKQLFNPGIWNLSQLLTNRWSEFIQDNCPAVGSNDSDLRFQQSLGAITGNEHQKLIAPTAQILRSFSSLPAPRTPIHLVISHTSSLFFPKKSLFQ